MHMDMDMQMGGFMAGWMATWGLLGVALLVLAVVATVWLVKDLTSQSRRSSPAQEEARH
jgi:putative membrane protein